MNSKENSPEPGPSSGRSYAAVVAGHLETQTVDLRQLQTVDEDEAVRIALKRSREDKEVRLHFAINLDNLPHRNWDWSFWFSDVWFKFVRWRGWKSLRTLPC